MTRLEHLLHENANTLKKALQISDQGCQQLISLVKQRLQILSNFQFHISHELKLISDRKNIAERRVKLNQQDTEYIQEETRAKRNVIEALKNTQYEIKETQQTMDKGIALVNKLHVQIKKQVGNKHQDHAEFQINQHQNIFRRTKLQDVKHVGSKSKGFSFSESDGRMTVKVEKYMGPDNMDGPVYQQFELLYIMAQDKFICNKPYNQRVQKTVSQFNFHRKLPQLESDLQNALKTSK